MKLYFVFWRKQYTYIKKHNHTHILGLAFLFKSSYKCTESSGQRNSWVLLHIPISWEQLNSNLQIQVAWNTNKNKTISTAKHWNAYKAAIFFKIILYCTQSFWNHVHHTVTFAAARFKTTWFMQIMQTTILETDVWETRSRTQTLHLCNSDFISQCNRVDEGGGTLLWMEFVLHAGALAQFSVLITTLMRHQLNNQPN